MAELRRRLAAALEGGGGRCEELSGGQLAALTEACRSLEQCRWVLGLVWELLTADEWDGEQAECVLSFVGAVLEQEFAVVVREGGS